MYKIGTFTSITTTGNQAITGVGFQPAGIIIISNGDTVADVASSIIYTIGAASSSTSRFTLGIRNEDATATGSVRQFFFSDGVICKVNTSNTVTRKADLVSLDSDGFTLNWSVQDGVAAVNGYIAFSSDFSFKVGTFDMSGSTGNQSVTGVGFQPKGLLFFNALDNTTEGVNSGITFASGAATSSTARWANAVCETDGADPTASRRLGISTACMVKINVAGTQTANADFVSMDGDGFTFNVATALNARWGYIAIGGTNTNAKAGTLTVPSSGISSITGVGFTPDFAMFGSWQDNVDGFVVHFGAAASSSSQICVTGTADDNQSTARVGRSFSTTAAIRTVGGTSAQDIITGQPKNWLSDGFTVDWPTPSAGIIFGYLALRSDAKVHLFKSGAEILQSTPAPNVRITSDKIEVLRSARAALRVSSAKIEVLRETTVPYPDKFVPAIYADNVIDPAGTGNSQVTGVPFRPGQLMFYGSGHGDNWGAAAAGGFWFFGGAMGTTGHWCSRVGKSNGSGADIYSWNTTRPYESYDASGTNNATINSIDDRGFTLNYGGIGGGAGLVGHYIAFSETIRCSTSVITLPASTTGNQSFTTNDINGNSFQPQVVILYTGPANDVDTSSITTYGHAGFGISTSSSSRWVFATANQTGNPRKTIRDNCCLYYVDGAGGTYAEADLVSLNSGGFTINVTTAPPVNMEVGCIALSGFDNVELGILQSPTSTGDQTVNLSGDFPITFLMFVGAHTALNTNGSSQGAIHIGVATGRNQFVTSSYINGNSGETTKYDNKCIATNLSGSGTSHEAKLVSMGNGEFTLNWNKVTGSSYYFPYVAIQATPILNPDYPTSLIINGMIMGGG